MLLTCLLPFLATKGSTILGKKMNETQVSNTVFGHLKARRPVYLGGGGGVPHVELRLLCVCGFIQPNRSLFEPSEGFSVFNIMDFIVAVMKIITNDVVQTHKSCVCAPYVFLGYSNKHQLLPPPS